jgi:hypothetical protein
MTKRILIGLILLLSTISCRKTSSTTGSGTSGTPTSSGTVSVKITSSKGTSNYTVYGKVISYWTDIMSDDDFGKTFHIVDSGVSSTELRSVHLFVDDEISIKNYTHDSETFTTKFKDEYLVDFGYRYVSVDGILKITNVTTGMESNRKYYVISGTWSGTFYDEQCNCEVEGVVTWNGTKFK